MAIKTLANGQATFGAVEPRTKFTVEREGLTTKVTIQVEGLNLGEVREQIERTVQRIADLYPESGDGKEDERW